MAIRSSPIHEGYNLSWSLGGSWRENSTRTMGRVSHTGSCTELIRALAKVFGAAI